MSESRGSYRPRIVDQQVERLLSKAGAVVVEGPKACGKTTTALRQARSAARLDRDQGLRTAGLADPQALLQGAVPRLIDEWQLVPEVWNAVRAEVDARQADGQFILTGSASPREDATRHSGAMRFIQLNMRPMTLAEIVPGPGGVSLSDLWSGKEVKPVTDCVISDEDLARLICVGGWPSNLGRDPEDAYERNRAYLGSIAGADIVTLDGIRRDPRKIAALIWALARNSATYVTNKTLQADTARYGDQIDVKTLNTYMDALTRLWVAVEQPAWGGHLRSRAAARKAPKRHLVDPSLAAAALDARPEDLLADREAYGFLFESLVFRDLYVMGQVTGLDVRCYQDHQGREIDAVLTRGAKWAGIEVKLAPVPDVLDAAARGLHRVASAMDSSPQFLAIVTGTGPTYRRPDGIQVIAAPHLRP